MPHGTFVVGTLDSGTIGGTPQDLNLAIGGVNKGKINGSTGQLEMGGKVIANPIIAEYTVTGSAVTSIDFQGLDINSHGGSYEIECRIVNATASGSWLYCFINGDTTTTNYYSQYLATALGSVSGGQSNFPQITSIDASTIVSVYSTLNITNGYTRLFSNTIRKVGSAMELFITTSTKTATVANITQLTFTGSVAGSIGVGSQIIIRRKDV